MVHVQQILLFSRKSSFNLGLKLGSADLILNWKSKDWVKIALL